MVMVEGVNQKTRNDASEVQKSNVKSQGSRGKNEQSAVVWITVGSSEAL
jgi:hypothetical protein